MTCIWIPGGGVLCQQGGLVIGVSILEEGIAAIEKRRAE